jgi:hypothetical protein
MRIIFLISLNKNNYQVKNTAKAKNEPNQHLSTLSVYLAITLSMFTKEEAQQKIAELTERFAEQIASYKKADYNETLTRRDFIDPFFKALGWDMDNSQGYAEAYREVIHEDKIKIGAATKAPDYSFRLGGGKRLFFVEAKKPSVLVKDDITPAYQVRRFRNTFMIKVGHLFTKMEIFQQCSATGTCL